MTTRLQDAFTRQGIACAGLGSPFMGRLMPLIGARLRPGTAVAERLLDWPGVVDSNGQSVPLRLAGALHGMVIDGSAPDLAAVYPPHEVSDDALWEAIERAFEVNETRLMAWLDQAPQTNEVRRAGVILPALWWVLAKHPKPVHLLELGASGGLNLAMDQFAMEIDGVRHGAAESPVVLAPDWRGAPPPETAPLTVSGRAGVDINPLDPKAPEDALRLTAYLWPDQPDRLARTRGAIALAEVRPDAGDAAGWLSTQLDVDRPGQLTTIYHTIAWQYFPEESKARAREAIDAAGVRATEDAPLALISMEADGSEPGAALTVETWPNPENSGPRLLARVDFHGRWINWQY